MRGGKKGKGKDGEGEGDEDENLCIEGVDPLYALSVHASKAAKDAGGAPIKDRLPGDATKDKQLPEADALPISRVSLFFSNVCCRDRDR